ncbi:MAG: hypothetical protein KGI75_26135 [Rhizobiaceae bacterium]|nr:hypothetical protein [Rhizobiaceae bacterium]
MSEAYSPSLGQGAKAARAIPRDNRFYLVCVAVLSFLGLFLTRFPGEMNPDSQSQFEQAISGVYNDWHPPVMARLWSVFRYGADGTWTMFLFQIVCYGAAFTLLALAMNYRGRPVSAWVVLLVGLFPPFLMQVINIHKDVGLAVTVLLAFALAIHFRFRSRPIPVLVQICIALLLAYAALVRVNGYFAVLPAAIFVWYPAFLRRPIIASIVTIVLSVVLVPVSGLVNNGLLQARSAGAMRTLQIFDLAGIGYFSGDASVLAGSISLEQLKGCYSPLIADPFYHGNRCGFVWDAVAGTHDTPSGLSADPDVAGKTIPGHPLGSMWLQAIATRPIAYLEHRITHFNSEMQFMTSSHEADIRHVISVVSGQPSVIPAPSASHRMLDLIRYGIWATPAFWLAVGLLVLAVTYDARRRKDHVDTASLTLALSGGIYIAAFFNIGVASDPRYQLWGMIAIFVATIFAAPTLVRQARQRSLPLALAFAVFCLVIATMVVCRWILPDPLFGVA